MAPLSPAESLFLLKPNRTPARETVKVTLLSLLAQGMVRMEEQQTRRLLRKEENRLLCARAQRAALPPHAAALLDLVRAAQDDTGSMADFVKRAQKAYGTNLEKFNRDFIVPALLSRGLIEESRILLFRPTNARRRAMPRRAGSRATSPAPAPSPSCIHSNPAEAAAIILAVGSTILLVNELRPYYRQISEVMRAQTASTDVRDSEAATARRSWNSTGSHSHGSQGPAASTSTRARSARSTPGGFDHGAFDLSAFDAGAFDALDTGMASSMPASMRR